MLAISTKFIGPTNYRPARIAATTANGHRLVVSYDYGLTQEQEHARAAMRLAATMKWDDGEWIAGSTATGYVFVRACSSRYRASDYPAI